MGAGAHDAVRARLCALLAEVTGEEPAAVRPDAPFSELGVDSVTAGELVARIEEAFDIAIPEEDALHLTSVEAVVRYVARRAA